MRYINLRLTYLLTYTQPTVDTLDAETVDTQTPTVDTQPTADTLETSIFKK